ncbi:hypothetical protein L2735_18145 [Shewanella olleyana]|uniref:hypothetical protein n=1 Tax=Shewanella olleyana TaxID=135626 RepID=UPI00200DDA3D|nr:hypothetical protein [Shewanella olleyana]MCL1068694.1 hypothetical protein [Shewanella olleyana]
MTELNKFIKNQHVYIKNKMKQPLINFTLPNEEQATWDSIAIKFKKENGITKNFLFNNNKKPNAKLLTNFTDDDRLSKDSHYLVLAYLLDLLKEDISISRIGNKQAISRKFMGYLNKNIALMTVEEIQKIVDTMGVTPSLNQFFDWLHKHNMISIDCIPHFKSFYKTTRDLSGDDAISAEKNMIPDEQAMLALGAIFYDTIPTYISEDKTNTSNWSDLIQSKLSGLDAFTCTMSVLAMAAPNRAAAEQTILEKQRVQSHTETVNGTEETVSYLNWPGSKGYKNNQKHINSEMAESVDRALHFTGILTEPARVLARFYNNPKLSLKKVLKDFEPSKENLAFLNAPMSKPTSLIHLGLLLGFFDGTDKSVRVTKDTHGAIELPTTRGNTPKYIKPINKVSATDQLFIVMKCPYIKQLLGARLVTRFAAKKYFAGKKSMTVAEFENHYIALNRDKITGYNKTQTKKIKYDHALFTFNEKQLNKQSASHFLLVPLGTLEHHYYRDLNKKSGSSSTIFERFGFSSEFRIKPHQFRHWQNDFLEKNNLPHILISMLSGRKNPEHTLTYIHTTDAQKASVISNIMFDDKTEEDVQETVLTRLQSQADYNAAMNSLSPTFVSEVGFCVQNLTLSPCTYMNDFDSQCALCSSSCHIAHDKDAINCLKDDLKVQKKRLEIVCETINFATSKAMQDWFKLHYRNTCMLKELINTLSDNSIKSGSIVRILTRSNVMRITDLEKKSVEQNTLSLPNSNEVLQTMLKDKINSNSSSDAKINFFGFLDSV